MRVKCALQDEFRAAFAELKTKEEYDVRARQLEKEIARRRRDERRSKRQIRSLRSHLAIATYRMVMEQSISHRVGLKCGRGSDAFVPHAGWASCLASRFLSHGETRYLATTSVLMSMIVSEATNTMRTISDAPSGPSRERWTAMRGKKSQRDNRKSWSPAKLFRPSKTSRREEQSANKLHHRIAHLERSLRDYETVKTQLQTSAREHGNLLRQIASDREVISFLDKKSKDLDDENMRLKRECEKLTASAAAFRSKMAEQERRIAYLELQVPETDD